MTLAALVRSSDRRRCNPSSTATAGEAAGPRLALPVADGLLYESCRVVTEAIAERDACVPCRSRVIAATRTQTRTF